MVSAAHKMNIARNSLAVAVRSLDELNFAPAIEKCSKQFAVSCGSFFSVITVHFVNSEIVVNSIHETICP